MTALLDVLDTIGDHTWSFDDEDVVTSVIPQQRDEFTCSRCFLIHHHSQLSNVTGAPVCLDCTG
jgi:hypothetical protein